MDTSFEILDSLISLNNQNCTLFHLKDEILPPAVNIIVFGDYRIPICKDCVDALLSDEWVILFCMSCLESRWVLKRLSKRIYDSNIMWMDKCPCCYNSI